MKTKVTLKELVGTKIIYAVLLVSYYWMWARRDWHDYYETVQVDWSSDVCSSDLLGIFTIVFFLLQAGRIRRYSKEEKDEMAIRNLHRTDAAGLKIMVVAVSIIAFASAIFGIEGRITGYALVAMILALAVIRFILFSIMDSKGV